MNTYAFQSVVDDVYNFYWCFLVYLLLKKNTGEVVSLKEERKLACSWLSNALRKRLFSPIVDSEINWLLNLLSDDIAEKSFSVMDILNNTLTTIRILNNSSDNY